MTVWQLLWALLRHALRGGRCFRVYVVVGDLPETVQQELDDRDLAIVGTYASHRWQDPFLVLTAKPKLVDAARRRA